MTDRSIRTRLTATYLTETGGNQMTESEINFVLDNIRFSTQLLVFGMGVDSKLWCTLNRKGRVTFAEDNLQWLTKISAEIVGFDNFDAKLVHYWTEHDRFHEYLGNDELVVADLVTECDTVIVDGPLGHVHGRCQSIATAAEIRSRYGATVFVHDVHRPLEITYCDHYFDEEYRGRGHMRLYGSGR